MKNQDFKINFKTVWVIVIASILLTIAGVYFRLESWEYSNILLGTALILTFFTWVIILSDIVKNKIYNKSFWLMIMIFMPSIAPLFYMIQRNRLIATRERINF